MGNARSTDDAKVGQVVLSRRLNGRHRAFKLACDFDQLPAQGSSVSLRYKWSPTRCRNGSSPTKSLCLKDRVGVSSRFFLHDKLQASRAGPRQRRGRRRDHPAESRHRSLRHPAAAVSSTISCSAVLSLPFRSTNCCRGSRFWSGAAAVITAFRTCMARLAHVPGEKSSSVAYLEPSSLRIAPRKTESLMTKHQKGRIQGIESNPVQLILSPSDVDHSHVAAKLRLVDLGLDRHQVIRAGNIHDDAALWPQSLQPLPRQDREPCGRCPRQRSHPDQVDPAMLCGAWPCTGISDGTSNILAFSIINS